MVNPIFKFKKDNGTLMYLYDKSRFLQYLRGLPSGEYGITVKRYQRDRSSNQNRYYWGVVVAMLADEWGWLPDELHDALKWQFLRVPGEDGKPDRVQSTTRLNTAEFEDYLSKIRHWAFIDYAVSIPLPNECEF